jgi:hypothetical protein
MLLRIATMASLFLTAALARPFMARADVFSGFTELDYSHMTTKSSDASGNDTMNRSNSFNQKYNLMLNTSLLPLLTLRAGYLFETDQTWLANNDRDTHTRITTSLPSGDLTLGSKLLNASLGYNRRKESTSSTVASSIDTYNEDYHGTLNWHPEGLPSVSFNLERTNIFDGQRLSQDSTNDRATLGLAYRLKGLDLRYASTYNDHTDKLEGVDITQTTHAARATYSGQFFQERVSLYSSYNISEQTTTTTTSGRGFVNLPITQLLGGLSAQIDNQGFLGSGRLEANQALIDGTASIDIGTATVSPPPYQNMGVDFVNSTTAVSRILLSIASQLFDKVGADDFKTYLAPLYTWSVYESSDNSSWKQVTVRSVQFHTDTRQFELIFDTTTAQYVKVAVAQLDPTNANVKNALFTVHVPSLTLSVPVTRIEAFNRVPAAAAQGQTSIVSNILNLDAKVRLLQDYALYYDTSFYLVSTTSNGFLKWTLSNALQADHQFNELVSASGRVAREDGEEPQGHRGAYTYNATLRVTPLRTLSHSIAYSGRAEMFHGQTNTSNSLYLSNTAEIYRGVNFSLNGGASNATNQTGEKVLSYNMISSLNVMPRRDLSLSINYSLNRTDLSGGNQGNVTSSTRRGDVGITYRPFTNLYLLASLGQLQQTDRKADLVQNYGLNWSPFPDGTLQFNFSYQENVRTQNEERSRLISPSLTWKITNRAILELSYPLLRTTSLSGATESETFSANLRMSF